MRWWPEHPLLAGLLSWHCLNRLCMVQIRVYPLAGVRAAEVDGEPLRAAYIHRLPAKISSIAWNPFDEVRALQSAHKESYP